MVHIPSASELWEHMGWHYIIVCLVDDSALIGVLMLLKFFSGNIILYLTELVCFSTDAHVSATTRASTFTTLYTDIFFPTDIPEP